jgi:hypothetical protein
MNQPQRPHDVQFTEDVPADLIGLVLDVDPTCCPAAETDDCC